MALYLYDRYNAIKSTVTIEDDWSPTTIGALQEGYGRQVLPYYTFNDGAYTLYGTQYIFQSNSYNQVGYTGGGSSILRLSNPRLVSSTVWNYDQNYKGTKQAEIYNRGSLVSTNMVAENGTYPVDGRHSDGYWYIRKGLAWTPPAISVKIGGGFRAYSDGWVKVNGTWRKIDEIHTKINGVWRKS